MKQMNTFKQKMKNLVPSRIQDYIKQLTYNKVNSEYFGMDRFEIFDQIYSKSGWGEIKSGPGSSLASTEACRLFLGSILIDYSIKTFLDLPCGDFHWMRRVEMPTLVDYLGGDIVPDLISENKRLYSKRNISFEVIDMVKDKLKAFDLILTRDCWVHLSFDEIFASIQNIKSSGSKYLLTTTFQKLSVNHDIQTGDWRPINLNRRPFSFPSPLEIQEENFTAENKRLSKMKSLALYQISDL